MTVTEFRNQVVEYAHVLPAALLSDFQAMAAELDSILLAYYQGRRLDDYWMRQEARGRYRDMVTLEKRVIAWRREHLGLDP